MYRLQFFLKSRVGMCADEKVLLGLFDNFNKI